MSEVYLERDGYTVFVEQDDFSFSPRDWDNLGTVIAFHPHYDIGDVETSEGQDVTDHINEVLKNDPKAIVLPVLMYDHSGVWLSTTREYPFTCPWDTSHVGFIYVTRDTLRKEYGVKRVSKKLRNQATRMLRDEIKTYSQYTSGDVWHARIENLGGAFVDSCGGLFGNEGINFFIEEVTGKPV